jgi:hypothetical protein
LPPDCVTSNETTLQTLPLSSAESDLFTFTVVYEAASARIDRKSCSSDAVNNMRFKVCTIVLMERGAKSSTDRSLCVMTTYPPFECRRSGHSRERKLRIMSGPQSRVTVDPRRTNSESRSRLIEIALLSVAPTNQPRRVAPVIFRQYL